MIEICRITLELPSQVTRETDITTDRFTISARPQLKMLDPWLAVPCLSTQEFILYGDMFDWVSNLYVSGGPNVYSQWLSSMSQDATATHWATYDPASGNSKISAMYPAFNGVPVTWLLSVTIMLTAATVPTIRHAITAIMIAALIFWFNLIHLSYVEFCATRYVAVMVKLPCGLTRVNGLLLVGVSPGISQKLKV